MIREAVTGSEEPLLLGLPQRAAAYASHGLPGGGDVCLSDSLRSQQCHGGTGGVFGTKLEGSPRLEVYMYNPDLKECGGCKGVRRFL